MSLIDQVQGHDQSLKKLLTAIEQDRLANTLIFAGPSGIGKRQIAWAIAQILLCEQRIAGQSKACGECGACRRVMSQQSESVHFVEAQGAGIKIEQASQIHHFLSLQQLGRARVVIINDAHLLNPQAGNSLLKAFEEPPPRTHFILVTANPSSMLATIRSRAQFVRFQPLEGQVLERLVKADPWVIRASQGSVEQALRLASESQEWSEVRKIAIEALREILIANGRSGLRPETRERLAEIMKDRNQALFCTQIWQRGLRDLSFLQLAGDSIAEEQLLMPELGLAELNVDPMSTESALAATLRLEYDIQQNADRFLSTEVFLQTLQQAFAN